MNANHSLCESPEWAEHLRDEVLPMLLRDADLGEDMLEIGPGPGAATDVLRHEVKRLTAVEVDEAAAARLRDRYAGTNVTVLVGSGDRLDFPDRRFDSVGTFTMLHHVPTAARQNRLLAEALRVLRPGGVLIGSDSLPSNDLHHFHADDTYNPVDPGSFVARLQAIGFGRVTVWVDWMLRFLAFAPEDTDQEEAR
jgi:SAM-dependent methyltransferase